MFSRFGATLLRGLFREIRGLRLAVEAGVDSYRTVNNLAPLFGEVEPAAEPLPRHADSTIHEGDFLTPHLIEQLFLEQRVPFDHTTDMEAVAKDLGWISPEGKFLVLPHSARGIDAEYLESVSAGVQTVRM